MSISGPGKAFEVAVAQPVNKQWVLKIISCLLSRDSCLGDRERPNTRLASSVTDLTLTLGTGVRRKASVVRHGRCIIQGYLRELPEAGITTI